MGRVSGAVGAALVVVALAGCQGDPEPRVQESPSASATSESASESPTPSQSVSQTPTDSANPVAPTMPAAENSDQGAKAFVAWWIELVNFSQSTGAIDELQNASDSRCAGCSGLIAAIEQPYAQGGRIEGGQFTVGDFESLPPDHGADWGGFGKGDVAPQTVINGAGGEQTSTGSPIYVYAYVAWLGDRWTMRFFRAVVPS